jgi:hypothetical protein
LASEPKLPATLGEVRWLDAHSLRASCRACLHEDVLNVEALPNSMRLSWFVSRFVCKRCGHRDADVLPSWVLE